MAQANVHTLVLVSSAIAWSLGCDGSSLAHLDDVTPSAIAPNGVVTVTGEHLCGVPADCDHAAGEFQLDSDTPIRALVMSYTDREAELQIPSLTPIGMVTLVLVVDDTASNGLSLEIVEP